MVKKGTIKLTEGTAPPELPSHLAPVLSLFWELHRARPVSMGGALCIPLTEVMAAFKLFGPRSQEVRLYYYELIKAMDAAYMDWSSRERETLRNVNSVSSNRRPKRG